MFARSCQTVRTRNGQGWQLNPLAGATMKLFLFCSSRVRAENIHPQNILIYLGSSETNVNMRNASCTTETDISWELALVLEWGRHFHWASDSVLHSPDEMMRWMVEKGKEQILNGSLLLHVRVLLQVFAKRPIRRYRGMKRARVTCWFAQTVLRRLW